MDLHQKIRTLPTSPGVYLYKNAEGQIIYVGKANNLRSRVRSYFLEGAAANAKTGTLLREAVDLDYVVVDNEKEALALENNLIKQKKPRYNILLRDDKTYPYIKLTIGERYPRVFPDAAVAQGWLAVLRSVLPHQPGIPACRSDPSALSDSLVQARPEPLLSAALFAVLHRAMPGAVRRGTHNARALRRGGSRREVVSGRPRRGLVALAAAAHERGRRARAVRTGGEVSRPDLDRRFAGAEAAHAAVEGDDADVFGYHYENEMLAVNLFHMRRGKIVDKREFFWEDLSEMIGAAGFAPGEFFSALLKQVYLDQQYVPHTIYVPVDFEDRATLEEILLSEGQKRHVQIHVPQRGDKRSLVDLVGQNAKQAYDQRFRVMKPAAKAIQEAVQDALMLPELPKRIECFDISHIQGAETVASMVVWEEGKIKKSDYRKFIIKSVEGVDDFASMREVVTRRYKRVQEEKQKMPSLVLIDGGIGQLHAAAQALEELGIVNQPLASIAKREEIIYVQGQEDEPVVLDRHSPVLHLVQLVRDEAHRFAVTFHRKRRQMRDRKTELLEIPGVGERTTKRLLQHFGSLQAVKAADAAALASVVSRSQAEAILEHFGKGS
jgi:excinuclease ABC subunit C